MPNQELQKELIKQAMKDIFKEFAHKFLMGVLVFTLLITSSYMYLTSIHDMVGLEEIWIISKILATALLVIFVGIISFQLTNIKYYSSVLTGLLLEHFEDEEGTKEDLGEDGEYIVEDVKVEENKD